MNTRGLAFGGLLAGGLAALVCGTRPWWRAAAGETAVTFSGSEATGGLTTALATVVLAGVLLALALAARSRRILGLLLIIVGAGMVVLGGWHRRPTPASVRGKLAQVSLIDTFALTSTFWPWGFAGAGLVVVAAALVMVLSAGRWPVRSSRFARTSAAADVDLAEDPAAAWQALDAGQDPTDVPAGTAAADRGPDVQSDRAGDTMGSNQDSTTPATPRSGGRRSERDHGTGTP